MCVVRAIKEQEQVGVMTFSFSDKGRAAVLDRPAEIPRSEITFKCITFQYGKTHFKNLEAFAARFFKFV